MSAVSKGNDAELFVADGLEDVDWVVASRRHIGGAGDLLAVRINRDIWNVPRWEIRLIEVKANRSGGPYANFRWRDRADMLETAKLIEAEPWLVHVLPIAGGFAARWIPSSEWPEGRAGLEVAA